MNEAPDDAVTFHLTQRLNQHFLRHGRYRTSQFREPSDVAAEQVKQNHQFPATFENPEHVLHTPGGGCDRVFRLTFR
jgi:hypothetical protein